MSKRYLLIIVSFIAVAVIAGIVYWCLQPSLSVVKLNEKDETNKVATAQPEQVANPLLVQKWFVAQHPTSYKVYYDDPCDEAGYFWGKEWNEEENILEEDLDYHGNGWFQWCIKGKLLIEVHLGSYNNFLVPIVYEMTSLTKDRLSLSREKKQYIYYPVSTTQE